MSTATAELETPAQALSRFCAPARARSAAISPVPGGEGRKNLARALGANGGPAKREIHLFQGTPSVLFVVAHPDDEVIGAGARLLALERARFVHVTDGSPRDLRDAYAAGCVDRLQYSLLRRREWHACLACAGFAPESSICLEIADQEASLEMSRLSRRLAELIDEVRPDLVVTHPYEGGHPDHDATALAVHAARRLLGLCANDRPFLVEMTSYHAGDSGMEHSRFLRGSESAVVSLPLSSDERAFKRALFDCHVSQRRVLDSFPIEVERFRLAPGYDFSAPPHTGQLFYEKFEWGMTGWRWRELALEALREMRLGGML